MTKIVALPAFQDNYIWAIHSLDGSHLIVVDPGTAEPVFAYLHKHKLDLTAVLITHHHWDHSGGINKQKEHYPNAAIIGPQKDNVQGLTQLVQENDTVTFDEYGLTLRVFDIPGHTLGHIAYYNDEMLFCGDTLFSCGCGRIFEGTSSQMYHSLDKLKSLPPNTLMYCGHEYTLANIAFAQTVEPNNHDLTQRKENALKLREQGLPTLPVTLATELQTNPFLRCDKPEVIQAVQKQTSLKAADPVSIFANLREWKNRT
ncbi:MAG: hydroxyacylglutathione hydrolase [Proteobacteria bacterium]|nr:hydroxyacylglutathione hydrolase [Pseudomonadota bacterium]